MNISLINQCATERMMARCHDIYGEHMFCVLILFLCGSDSRRVVSCRVCIWWEVGRYVGRWLGGGDTILCRDERSRLCDGKSMGCLCTLYLYNIIQYINLLGNNRGKKKNRANLIK